MAFNVQNADWGCLLKCGVSPRIILLFFLVLSYPAYNASYFIISLRVKWHYCSSWAMLTQVFMVPKFQVLQTCITWNRCCMVKFGFIRKKWAVPLYCSYITGRNFWCINVFIHAPKHSAKTDSDSGSQWNRTICHCCVSFGRECYTFCQ